LEVESLDGLPGVLTARFADIDKDPEKNMDKVLRLLEDKPNRNARFRTIIALILDGAVYCFEGIVQGSIAHSKSGKGGFGYDPVFIPNGYSRSFGELDQEIKNQISHRARATAKLVQFLEHYVKCKSPG
jgi:XTP/dITP diphosphohydrolase